MKIGYIHLAGEDHPLCFSLSAAEKITAEFGDMEGMGKALSGSNMNVQLAAISKTLDILLDAGRKYAEVMGMDLPRKLPCKAADIIDITDESAIKAIFSAVQAGSDRDVEVASKNVEAGQG